MASKDEAFRFLCVVDVSMWKVAADYPICRAPEPRVNIIRSLHGVKEYLRISLYWIQSFVMSGSCSFGRENLTNTIYLYSCALSGIVYLLERVSACLQRKPLLESMIY